MPSSQPRPTGSRPPTGPPSGSASGARSGSRTKPRSSERSGARVAPTRTIDLTEGKPPAKPRPKSPAGKSAPKSAARPQGQPAFNPHDPGVKRRAAKKAQRRQKNMLVWGIFAGLTTIIGGMAFGVCNSPHYRYRGVWHEYQEVKGKVAQKQNLLRALQSQLAHNQKRLAEFAHNKGRERALVENGFIRDGDRLLLFPQDEATDAAKSKAQGTAPTVAADTANKPNN